MTIRFMFFTRSAFTHTAALITTLLTITGCQDDVRAQSVNTASYFQAGITEMSIEIDYQSNAAPFGVSGTDTEPSLVIFLGNLEVLFETHPRPTTILPATSIGTSTQSHYTAEQILALADTHRDHTGTDTQLNFYVVFLDGYFEQDGETLHDTLGVSIGSTGVIAMFKPVINASAPDIPNDPDMPNTLIDDIVRSFVEQITLIHEFGHAIGFVNNGLDMVVDHQDEEHGAHCTNPDCVMNYVNEGAGDLVDFAMRFTECQMDSDSEPQPECLNTFGQECLNDAYAAAQQGAQE